MNNKNLIPSVIVIILVTTISLVALNYRTALTPITSNVEQNNATTTSNTFSSTTLTYENTEYGFKLILPLSWANFKSTTSDVQYGHIVTLIHPSSTLDNPRMNIPILIYSTNQWNTWIANDFEGYPTAAPIGPTFRASNTRYVFATAPRYNFSFSEGFEEVEKIIQTITAK